MLLLLLLLLAELALAVAHRLTCLVGTPPTLNLQKKSQKFIHRIQVIDAPLGTLYFVAFLFGFNLENNIE